MNRQRIYEKANLPGILVDTGRTYFHAFLSNHRLIFFYARAVPYSFRLLKALFYVRQQIIFCEKMASTSNQWFGGKNKMTVNRILFEITLGVCTIVGVWYGTIP